MDKLRDRSFNANYIILISTFIISAFVNIKDPFKLMFLSSILIFSIGIKDTYFFREEKRTKLINLWILFDIFLAILINYYFQGEILNLYYLSIFFLIIMYYRISLAVVAIIITATFDCVFVQIIKYNKNLLSITTSLGIYILIFIILYILRQAIEQNNQLNSIKESLLIKSVDNVIYNRNITLAYDKVEELSRVQERMNISREIHDTVGHTLTTALYELQSGNLIMDKNPEEAKEKILLGTELVRKSLREMRIAVREFKDKDNDFYNDIFILTSDTEKTCNVKIHLNVEDYSKETKEIQKTIYRLVQEALTNGIKHGQADRFIISVKYSDSDLNIYIGNNGIGVSVINKGFGMLSMEERIRLVSGEISFESSLGEGFNIYAKIKGNRNND